jgi:hypothetical protein
MGICCFTSTSHGQDVVSFISSRSLWIMVTTRFTLTPRGSRVTAAVRFTSKPRGARFLQLSNHLYWINIDPCYVGGHISKMWSAFHSVRLKTWSVSHACCSVTSRDCLPGSAFTKFGRGCSYFSPSNNHDNSKQERNRRPSRGAADAR